MERRGPGGRALILQVDNGLIYTAQYGNEKLHTNSRAAIPLQEIPDDSADSPHRHGIIMEQLSIECLGGKIAYGFHM